MFPIRDHNPSEKTPFVTYALIALNVVIFAYGAIVFQSERQLLTLYYDYAMIPARISAGENWTSFATSTFLHAGVMHLGGNMLFLWIFGDNMEEELGHVGFLIFYLICGVSAGIAQYVTSPFSPVPTVGASGAIAGVMGGYLLLFPKARVDILLFLIIIIRIFPIPAWIMLGLWFAMQLFNGVGASSLDGGVAYWAHAGGFVIGFLLTIPLFLRKGGTRFWDRTEGHPPHPEAQYPTMQTRVPRVRRK